MIGGFIAAPVLPLDADENPDLEAYARHLRQIADQRPDGMAVNTSAGEAELLSAEELETVLSAAATALRGRVPMIAGIPTVATRDAVRLATAAHAAGAAGLLVFPPRVLSGTPPAVTEIVRYHRTIHDASGLPLVVFQRNPQVGGASYDVSVLRALAELDSVVAIKEASFDAEQFKETVRVLHECPRPITVLTGNDTFIFESYLLGADGALLGLGAVAVGKQIAQYRAIRQRRYDEARALRNQLDPLAMAIFGPPMRNYRARLKEALVLQGAIPRATVRSPLGPITAAERDAIRRALLHAGELVLPAPAP